MREPVQFHILRKTKELISLLDSLNFTDKVQTINSLRQMIHDRSPFKGEPVDCVLWIPSERVKSNDYNPNKVAKPEMELLKQSISEDGLTMPIVSWPTSSQFEIVDGFHRSVVCETLGKEYLPLSFIRKERNDRISATIRHNRARGKHEVSCMSDIVIELKRRGWSDAKIATNLGMDKDEILRLTQITGLTDMFSDSEFSEAWEHEASLV